MAPDLDDLRRQLERIPGLDLEAGLGTTGGRLESLARLLRKYAASHAEDDAVLRREWTSGDRVAAHRLAHSVKSAAGFLGLLGVQALAAEVEAALREPSGERDPEPLIAAFAQANGPACEAIRTLPEADAPEAPRR